MLEISVTEFAASLANYLGPKTAGINRARTLRGGGNIESWIMAQYLLSFPAETLPAIDYYREYAPPSTGAPGDTSISRSTS